MMKNAMLITPKDNVVVAIEPIAKGSQIVYQLEKEQIHIMAKQDIPIYHKAAICGLKKGDMVIKYGELIGIATEDIQIGIHVHSHNMESPVLLKARGLL